MNASPIVSLALLPLDRPPPLLLVRATARELEGVPALFLVLVVLLVPDPALVVAFLAIMISCRSRPGTLNSRDAWRIRRPSQSGRIHSIP